MIGAPKAQAFRDVLGYAPRESFKIERLLSAILRILLEIFPFPKSKGQNAKNVKGYKDLFSIFILQR